MIKRNWVIKQQKISLQYLLENISRPDTPQGFVVASPSKQNPNYYYHWVRDAALVMRAIDSYLPDGLQKDALFKDYLNIVKQHQSVNTLTGLGEPKFNPDGTGYSEPWGRPQNDGPALRAFTLINYVLKNQEEVIKLYYPTIKKDLDYTALNWREPDFDLWEEVKGNHFYTRMTQRSALYLGAQLAEQLNDKKSSDWYLYQAQLLGFELEKHWSAKSGYILTTLNQTEGLNYKHMNLDSSVILAVNHASLPGLSFGPDDPRVLATYKTLKNMFSEIYEINNTRDKNLGTAVGRYPEDSYYGGNPWFLLTNAMAEYLFSIIKPDEAYSYMLRTKKHMHQENGRMSEQYSRHNGYMLGANDLTWSYASFLTIKPYAID